MAASNIVLARLLFHPDFKSGAGTPLALSENLITRHLDA